MPSDGPGTPSGIEGFDYFVVRLARTRDDPGRLAGQVERLGSGERRSFDTGEQLVHLVTGWSGRGPDEGEPTNGRRRA